MKHILLENNVVHDCWGEGIDFTLCNDCVGRGNIVYDTWSVLLYCDNVQNVVIENNYLFTTSDRYNRGEGRTTAFLVGTENWPDDPIPDINITYRNNLAVHVGSGVSYYGEGHYYSKIQIYHNTFFNITGAAIYFPEVLAIDL